MSLILVTPPAALPLSLAEAKAAARIEGNDDDALVASLIRAAVAEVDGKFGWLGRQLISATWDYRTSFAPWVIRVPLPPLIEVISVSYTDPDGVPQVVDPSMYFVAGIGGADPARIIPEIGASWPATRRQPAPVTVRFVAGFGDSWNSVPEDLRAALSLMVAASYDGCESAAATSILLRYRIW
jgi:uncharacterized phiE125 gp8 family phage protein